VEKDLTRDLESGRVKDVANKLEACDNLQKDLTRLRAKHEDMKKILVSHSDPDHHAIARSQPLSAEQLSQQHDLRRDFTKFQKLLGEAEEGLTILKAKLVSQANTNGKGNGTAGPTVEAVMRTITKMTSMAEKRSGDIDVLEGQLRKLQFSSATRARSREGSPFATPQNKASLRNPGTSSTYSLFYTPDSTKDTPRGFQNSITSSTHSCARGTPPRKKMSGFTTVEKAQLRKKLARRKEVTDRLRLTLQKAGTNVRLMDGE
jgi:nucleoporin NUP159